MDSSKTSVSHVSCDYSMTKTEAFPLKYNKLNDLYIDFDENEINFNDKITVTGDFELLNFIVFKSEEPASWVVQESRFHAWLILPI